MTAVEAASAAQSEAEVMEQAGALAGRLFEATLGTMELETVYLGLKLGLYDALERPATAGDLAGATGLLPRYVREWCEQQAAAGILLVDDPSAAPEDRVFALPAAHAAVLTDETSPAYAAPMALLVGGAGAVMPAVLDAWRAGRGMSFGEYGDDVRVGQGGFNRIGFDHELAPAWVPAMPDVAALLARPGARVADVACGVGWSTIALSRAYPDSTVLGLDSDEASIMDARAHAAAAGCDEHVRFEVLDAAAPLPASYDVVFVFEALHDMAHPVPALRAMRESLRPGGRVVVMDEHTLEEFTPDAPPPERLFYAGSVLHCLPVGLSQEGSAGTGALMRPATLRAYAAEAGFADVQVAPIDNDLMRFYVLTP